MVEDGIPDNVLHGVPLDLDRHGFAMVVKSASNDKRALVGRPD
jgi:hypothetical protein